MQDIVQSPETLDFIQSHLKADVRQLALSAGRLAGVDVPFALNQIQGWQIARHKLPRWAATQGVVYPPHLSMEQCSSQLTARYKASLASRLVQVATKKEDKSEPGNYRFVDLTGGFGVDFAFLSSTLSSNGARTLYVESNASLAAIVSHNLPLLGLPCASVLSTDSDSALQTVIHSDLIFLDPARRDDNGHKVAALQNCSPNVLELLPQLLCRSQWVLIKLSPMLSWVEAVRQLRCVSQVNIVSVDGECKELLLVLSSSSQVSAPVDINTIPVTCACLSHHREATVVTLHTDTPESSQAPVPLSKPVAGMYLYEPDAAVMSSGCFGSLCRRYHLSALHPNTRLYVSTQLINSFPGRVFTIKALSGFGKKQLRQALAGITSANVAVRNFPMKPAQLSSRLKLSDGGTHYLFATTVAPSNHVLLLCEKAPL